MNIALPIDSRYKDTPVYSSSKGTEFGLWVSNPSFRNNTEFQLLQITDADVGRLDRISYNYYGTPSYWWIIADANNIVDPIRDMKSGDILRLPSQEIIDQYVSRSPA